MCAIDTELTGGILLLHGVRSYVIGTELARGNVLADDDGSCAIGTVVRGTLVIDNGRSCVICTEKRRGTASVDNSNSCAMG